jgi:hypothetical protein
MFSRLREHFGTAGLVVAVIALVAALTGGAYAASGGLSGKQKKEVEKIAKKLAGKPGAAGTNGTNGTNGAPGSKGDAGAPGTNGKDGAPGKNGANGAPGAPGDPGPFVAQVPSGKSLNGFWSAAAPGNFSDAQATLSFPFPVSPAPTLVYIEKSGETGLEVKPTGFAFPAGVLGEEEVEALCPGTVDDPTAEPGFVCVYTGTEQLMEKDTVGGFLAGKANPTKYGASIPFVGSSETEPGFVSGTWAATAE